jgi:hypothetical protein
MSWALEACESRLCAQVAGAAISSDSAAAQVNVRGLFMVLGAWVEKGRCTFKRSAPSNVRLHVLLIWPLRAAAWWRLHRAGAG